MNKPRRSLLEYVIWATFGFIASVMAALMGAAVTQTAFVRRREDWLEVAPLRTLTRSPVRFDVKYVHRHGWKVEERTEVVYAYLDQRGKPTVLSSTCTHLGCTVRWNAKDRIFECPCHGGVYDAQGKVIDGPPPRDLSRFPSRTEQNKVLIQRA